LQRLVIPGFETPTPAQERAVRQREKDREAVLKAFERKAAAIGFSENELRGIIRRLFIATIPAGREVIAPGDTPDFASVVGTGCIKTVIAPPLLDPSAEKDSIQPITVQFAKPSYIFGLAPIATSSDPGAFGAIAHVDSTVVVVSRDLMREIVARTPPAARLTLIAYHARGMSRLIYEKCCLASLSVRERLLRELAQLARLFPSTRAPGAIDLPLSHQDLAELVGASRFTVMRTLAELRDRVRVNRNRYTLSKAPLASELPPPSRGPSAPRGRGDDPGSRRRFARSLGWAHERLGLPRRVIRILIDGALLASYEPGERIVGGDGLHATILWSGAARVMVTTGAGGSVGAWIAKPGHFIGVGWAGERAHHARAFWALALTRCEVAVLKPQVMIAALAELSPEQILKFLSHLHIALSRQLYDRCVTLGLGNTERLLYQLARLASDFPDERADGVRIDLPIRPSRDLAPMLAMSRTVFSRAFSALKAAGRVVIAPDGAIVVRRAQPDAW
jgi:CRP-like cAMP-binding protein